MNPIFSPGSSSMISSSVLATISTVTGKTNCSVWNRENRLGTLVDTKERSYGIILRISSKLHLSFMKANREIALGKRFGVLDRIGLPCLSFLGKNIHRLHIGDGPSIGAISKKLAVDSR